MRKFKRIKVELYRAKIYYICCSVECYKKIAKKEFKMDVDAKAARQLSGSFDIAEKRGRKVGVIWIYNKCKDGFVSTVVHECVHATAWILADCGVSFSDESEESYAYLTTYLVTNILRRIK
jgi:hypothetical protein